VLEHLGLDRAAWDALAWYDAQMYLEYLEERLEQTGGARSGGQPEQHLPDPAGPAQPGIQAEPPEWARPTVVHVQFGEQPTGSD
jgi:hypothetical protein